MKWLGRRARPVTAVVVNVKSLRLQCSTCGTPVDTLRAPNADVTLAHLTCAVEPCGHQMCFQISQG